MHQKKFIEDMGLLIVKNHMHVQFVENLWMKCLCLQEMFPKLVEKTKQLHVLLALAKCNFLIVNFDLWMSKGVHDIFALMINSFGTSLAAKMCYIWSFKG